MAAWTCLTLLLLLPAPPEKPRRQPDGAATFEVETRIVRSTIGIAADPDRAIDWLLWYQREPGRRFSGAASGRIPLDGGGSMELGEVRFATDAELDPLGEGEALESGRLGSLAARPLATSDLALLPLRAVLLHEVAFEGGRREATKERSLEGAVARMWEKRLGLQRIGLLTLEQRVTRIERHFVPSGHRLLDVCFTCEDSDENQVLYARGVRLLVAPKRPTDPGDPLASPVLLHLEYRACQVGWKNDSLPIPDGERHVREAQWPALEQRFRAQLGNVLLDALPDDGLGDPFDAPWAYLCAADGLLDERFVRRLSKIEDRRGLLAAAPALLAEGVAVGKEPLRSLYVGTADPVKRLLLGALLERAGGAGAEVERERRLASASKHPAIREALSFLNGLR